MEISQVAISHRHTHFLSHSKPLSLPYITVLGWGPINLSSFIYIFFYILFLFLSLSLYIYLSFCLSLSPPFFRTFSPLTLFLSLALCFFFHHFIQFYPSLSVRIVHKKFISAQLLFFILSLQLFFLSHFFFRPPSLYCLKGEFTFFLFANWMSPHQGSQT